MREILFRGKRVDNGEWVYANHLYDNVTGKHFIVPFDNITESTKVNEEGCCYCVGFEVIPETVGQYTGLTDKNGKKIFEGDIVEFDNDKIGYVVYDEQETEYGIVYDENIYCGLGRNYIDKALEVVGNIHDNHELLDKG